MLLSISGQPGFFKTMTAATGKRSYRACHRCRQRKTRCDLSSIGEEGKTPCLECHRSGHECTLPPSRRGGDYTRYRKRSRLQRSPINDSEMASESPQSTTSMPVGTAMISEQASEPRTTLNIDDLDEEPILVELKNPSDALQILARTTSHCLDEDDSHEALASDTNAAKDDASFDSTAVDDAGDAMYSTTDSRMKKGRKRGIKDYKLVAQGLVDAVVIERLIQLYAQNYHDFVPIVPMNVFEPSNIDQVATDETFLLTAIITIASKDEPVWSAVHRRCWEHMKELLLEVLLALPNTHRVGLVEGLLLLSDWLPSLQSRASSDPRRLFAEDATAWSLIGQAVRHSYLLRLDRTSFREDVGNGDKKETDRKRLVWTFVYLADRQISVRLGQSFWSRGPALSSKFTAKDFPSLQPDSTGGEDHASVLQATMELTQLLHNTHDILYSSRARTLELALAGDYGRYLDDFQRALLIWNNAWKDLTVSPRLKCVLSLMHEYLCLYVNAFSFQAVVTRNSSEAREHRGEHGADSGNTPIQSVFQGGIMAMPEGRYIFEALRAAKAALKIMGQADATSCMRYMPARYYLYGIYSAVFIYKASSFGSFTSESEQNEVGKLVEDFIATLERAATTRQHISWRYSKLLKSLWARKYGSKRTPSVRPHRQTTQETMQARLGDSNIDVDGPPEIRDLMSRYSGQEMDAAIHAMEYESMGSGSIGSFSQVDFDPFSATMQSMDQTNSMLDSLFTFDNINVVPPFMENMAL